MGEIVKLMILLFVLTGPTCSGGGNDDDESFLYIPSVEPINGARNVDLNPTIRVNFNYYIDESSVNTSTFYLRDSRNNLVPGSIQTFSSSAVFVPLSDLEYSTTYTATVTKGIKDRNGGKLSEGHSWYFITRDEPTIPQVVSTYPALGQANMLVSTNIQVTFSVNMNAASVNSDTFRIVDNALNPVAGSIFVSNTTATFTPSNSFEYSMGYTVTLDSSIMSSDDGMLGEDYVWNFSTLNVIGSAANIESTIDKPACPNAIYDSTNAAHVIWNQDPDSAWVSVWSNRYTPASGWGAASEIESENNNVLGCPAVAAYPNGNVLAVWSQQGIITLNRYNGGVGWGTPEIVGGTAGVDPQVEVDSSGNIIVVWEEQGNIWARRYESGTGWLAATTIESSVPAAYKPNIAMDSNGNATVVWAQLVTGLSYSVAANYFTVGSGWETPITINSAPVTILDNTVRVAVDANNTVTAVWSQAEGSTIYNVWANQFKQGSGWGTPVILDSDQTISSSSPHMSAYADDTVVVWVKNNRMIKAVTYTVGVGWGADSVITTGSLSPKVAISADKSSTGKIAVGWNHLHWNGVEYEYGTRVIQFTPGVGWGDIALLAPNNSPGSDLAFAVDNSGNFLAAWAEGSHVKVNIFQ